MRCLIRSDLHYATADGELTRLNQLLIDGADPNAVDGDGFTPLHFAAQSYEAEAVRLLVEAGAEVDVPNARDNTDGGAGFAMMASH